jgi:hypothetical protein
MRVAAAASGIKIGALSHPERRHGAVGGNIKPVLLLVRLGSFGNSAVGTTRNVIPYS